VSKEGVVKRMDIEEWTSMCERKDTPVVLVLSTSACVRCPPAKACIETLAAELWFAVVSENAGETELTEHFGVSQLPGIAIVVPKERDALILQGPGATPSAIESVLRSVCQPRLVLDAEF
jgi:hypothetical protein